MKPLDFLLILLGYTSFSFSSSDKTNGHNKFDRFISDFLFTEINTSLKFNFLNKNIHLHHWMICLLIYIILYNLNYKKISLIFLGGCIQGIINYHDWKYIIY